jgi:4-hydroxy-tetrahydrodipicolinate reductase
MGQAVCLAVQACPDLTLTARFDRPGAAEPGLVAQETAIAAADVIVDFSTARASTALAEACAAHGGPALVIGSTGFDAAELARLAAAAERAAIVRAGNYSLGVNMLIGLVEQAARALPADYDVEVFEAHHRRRSTRPPAPP